MCVCVCVCACECVSLSYICIKFLSPSRRCAAWPPAPTVHGRWAHQLLLRPTRCWQTAPCLEIRNPRADRGRFVAGRGGSTHDQGGRLGMQMECSWNALAKSCQWFFEARGFQCWSLNLWICHSRDWWRLQHSRPAADNSETCNRPDSPDPRGNLWCRYVLKVFAKPRRPVERRLWGHQSPNPSSALRDRSFEFIWIHLIHTMQYKPIGLLRLLMCPSSLWQCLNDQCHQHLPWNSPQGVRPRYV